MLGFVVLLLLMWLVFRPAYQLSRRSAAAAPDAGGQDLSAESPGPRSLVPSGTSLEEYVQQGLMDLRIMLIQRARESG